MRRLAPVGSGCYFKVPILQALGSVLVAEAAVQHCRDARGAACRGRGAQPAACCPGARGRGERGERAAGQRVQLRYALRPGLQCCPWPPPPSRRRIRLLDVVLRHGGCVDHRYLHGPTDGARPCRHKGGRRRGRPAVRHVQTELLLLVRRMVRTCI